MVTLTYLAACTTTVRLGTAMLLLPQRNPVYMAKEVSSLDWLSGGRVDLGIGVGWLKEEFDALNVPWERRGARTDEYLRGAAHAVVRRHVLLRRCDLPPDDLRDVPQADPAAPPAHPHRRRNRRPPCGAPPRAGQGWHTFNRSPAELAEGLAMLDVHLEAAGRSRRDLRITVCPYFNQLTPERCRQYAEAGADAVAALFFCFSADDVASTFDASTTSRAAGTGGEPRTYEPGSDGGTRGSAGSPDQRRRSWRPPTPGRIGVFTDTPRRGPSIPRRLPRGRGRHGPALRCGPPSTACPPPPGAARRRRCRPGRAWSPPCATSAARSASGSSRNAAGR